MTRHVTVRQRFAGRDVVQLGRFEFEHLPRVSDTLVLTIGEDTDHYIVRDVHHHSTKGEGASETVLYVAGAGFEYTLEKTD